MKQNYPQKYLWRNRICHKYIDMCALIGNLLLMVMRRYLKTLIELLGIGEYRYPVFYADFYSLFNHPQKIEK